MLLLVCIIALQAKAQQPALQNPDTLKTIVLDSVINITAHKLSAQDFIDAVLADTGFYEAFRDMKQYAFRSESSVYTFDKKDRLSGKMYRLLQRSMKDGKPALNYITKADSGSLYKKNGKYQSYTVEMFDYLFFNAYRANPSSNVTVAASSGKNQSYKSKLKTLLFRPGTKVKGIPFVSGKTEIFSPELKQFYYYQFARGTYLDSIPVYRFKVMRKPSTAPGDVIINEMTTIFDVRTFEILGRYVDMSADNMFFNFNVRMNIELNRFDGKLLPVKVSYQGGWDMPFHKQEKASVFIIHKDYQRIP